jgi:transposase InsO family protein
MDNGTPWGASGGLPTALVLWLAGLGIGVLHNPPRCPQDNGVIERSQGTGKRWAEPWQCDGVADLQQRIDEADQRQRQRYPYRNGHSRSVVFPELWHSGRRYSEAWEQRHWDLGLAEALLSEQVVARQVDATGCVSLYSRNVYVGKSWARQTV